MCRLVDFAWLAGIPAPLHRSFVNIVDTLILTISWEAGLTLECLGLAGLGDARGHPVRGNRREAPGLGLFGVGRAIEQGQAPHLARVLFVVEAGCRMHLGAVVPSDDIARLPAPLHSKIRSGDEGQQVSDDQNAVVLYPFLIPLIEPGPVNRCSISNDGTGRTVQPIERRHTAHRMLQDNRYPVRRIGRPFLFRKRRISRRIEADLLVVMGKRTDPRPKAPWSQYRARRRLAAYRRTESPPLPAGPGGNERLSRSADSHERSNPYAKTGGGSPDCTGCRRRR